MSKEDEEMLKICERYSESEDKVLTKLWRGMRALCRKTMQEAGGRAGPMMPPGMMEGLCDVAEEHKKWIIIIQPGHTFPRPTLILHPC